MENIKKNTPVQDVLAQLKGFNYRQAIWILECAKIKLQDCSYVEEYIPKVHHEAQPVSEDKT